jgi:hypothetical protein
MTSPEKPKYWKLAASDHERGCGKRKLDVRRRGLSVSKSESRFEVMGRKRASSTKEKKSEWSLSQRGGRGK